VIALAQTLVGQYHRLRSARAVIARQSFPAFAEFVLHDEVTHRPVKLSPMHAAIGKLLDHPRVVLHAFTESGKSSLVTVGRTLFELGKDTSLRCAIVSNTAHQGQRLLRTVGQYIERSPELRMLYPKLRPAEPWTSSALFVERPNVSKDPSVQALGAHGNVLGARLDLLILDDVLDYENTRTPEQRKDFADWYNATLSGRLTARSRVIVLGTAWRPDDFLHELSRSSGWVYKRFPILDDKERSQWPERWPLARIAARRAELGPMEFARQMLCLARSDEDARFKQSWIADALERGRSLCPARQLIATRPGWYTVVGVDLGISTSNTADLTAFAAVVVNGDTGDRQLLSVESGRWTADTIIAKIHDHHRRYQPQSIVVENVQAQDFIVQLVRLTSALPVLGFKTGAGKMSLPYQAEGLATELSNGKWLFPASGGTLDPEVAALVRDLLYYSPTAHVGDRLAALLFARWGCARGEQVAGSFQLGSLLSR
jgi:hypothetical protein